MPVTANYIVLTHDNKESTLVVNDVLLVEMESMLYILQRKIGA